MVNEKKASVKKFKASRLGSLEAVKLGGLKARKTKKIVDFLASQPPSLKPLTMSYQL